MKWHTSPRYLEENPLFTKLLINNQDLTLPQDEVEPIEEILSKEGTFMEIKPEDTHDFSGFELITNTGQIVSDLMDHINKSIIIASCMDLIDPRRIEPPLTTNGNQQPTLSNEIEAPLFFVAYSFDEIFSVFSSLSLVSYNLLL